jgi:hypothetical protein
MTTRDATKTLRAGDTAALVAALQVTAGNLTDAAELLGFAGPSTIWRIAYDVPAVRTAIEQYGRRRGRQRKARTT